MLTTRIKFTYQDYQQLPGDRRYELIEGEFYMVPAPGWSHQTILKKLFRILDDHVTSRRLGEIRFAPLDVVLSEEDVLQPDIMFISEERSYIISERNIQGAPDLVVEILSSSTGERDRGLKQKLYARYGVEEYWIVDPGEKSVEVMGLGEAGFETVGIYSTGQAFSSPLLKGPSLNVDEIF